MKPGTSRNCQSTRHEAHPSTTSNPGFGALGTPTLFRLQHGPDSAKNIIVITIMICCCHQTGIVGFRHGLLGTNF